MTYSKKKYLSGEYDYTNPEEIKIYQEIVKNNLSGIEYNLFIKDYIIKKIRYDLYDFDFINSPNIQQLASLLLPLILVGMFDTSKQILMNYDMGDLSYLKDNWIKTLEEADDID